jgi:hypothetical protein
MFSLLKLLVFLVMVGAILWFGSTVKLGDHTLFGHVQRIWNTAEAQDLVKGAKEKAGPAVEKVKRGVKAGVAEAEKDDDGPDAGPRIIVKQVEDGNALGAEAEARPARPAKKPSSKRKSTEKKPAPAGP